MKQIMILICVCGLFIFGCSPVAPIVETNIVHCPKTQCNCPEPEINNSCAYDIIDSCSDLDYAYNLPSVNKNINYVNTNNKIIIHNSFVKRTKGRSMFPSIMENHTAIYSLCLMGECDLEVGDIISYERDKMHVSHRITEVHDDYVITRGDNTDYYERVDLLKIHAVAVGELYTDKLKVSSWEGVVPDHIEVVS
jgi:hypothetical protein